MTALQDRSEPIPAPEDRRKLDEPATMDNGAPAQWWIPNVEQVAIIDEMHVETGDHLVHSTGLFFREGTYGVRGAWTVDLEYTVYQFSLGADDKPRWEKLAACKGSGRFTRNHAESIRDVSKQGPAEQRHPEAP